MLRALIFDFDGLIVDTESPSLSSVQAVGSWLAAASGSRVAGDGAR